MNSPVLSGTVVYVPVWQRESNLEEAFATAKVGDTLLSDIAKGGYDQSIFAHPISPTEVMEFRDTLVKNETLTPSFVFAIPICDMSAISDLTAIEVKLENLSAPRDLAKNPEIALQLLDQVFEIAEKSGTVIPEGSRYSFPPLVNLYQPKSVVVDENGLVTEMVVETTVRTVSYDAPIKGWAFVGNGVATV